MQVLKASRHYIATESKVQKNDLRLQVIPEKRFRL